MFKCLRDKLCPKENKLWQILPNEMNRASSNGVETKMLILQALTVFEQVANGFGSSKWSSEIVAEEISKSASSDT